MASELFNSISGYSIGIPPIEVIDSNGNIKTNVFTTGNVTASNVYAAEYFYANGDPISRARIAGNNTQVQFNDNDLLGASASFTFDITSNLLSISNLSVTNTSFLGSVSNVKIMGGQPNHLLSTDGAGNLSWVEINTDPGGSNTQIQFNNNGVLSGASGLTFNNITNTVTTGTIVATDFIGNLVGTANTAIVSLNVTNNNQPNITSLGMLTSLSVTGNTNVSNIDATNGFFTNISGNGSGLSNITGANVVGAVANATFSTTAETATTAGTANTALSVSGANVTGEVANATFAIAAGTVTTAAQPNITSLGTLTSIEVTGNSILSNANVIGALNSNSISSLNILSNSIIVNSYLRANTNSTVDFLGNVNLAYSPNIYLGNVSHISISGGNAGFVLTTNGMGSINWEPPPGGPGGANTQVQYNNSGNLAGSPNFTFNNQTDTLTIAGNLVANTFQMGVGPYGFFTSEVFLTSTSSNAPNQELYLTPASDVASIDFVIISTDITDGTRTSTKISATVLGSVVAYSEYAGLQINGGVGSFIVGYKAANIPQPASVVLLCSPDSSNYTTHNILITKYASI